MAAPVEKGAVGQGLGSAFRWAVRRLRKAGIDPAASDARLLLGAATGLDRAEQIVAPERALTDAECRRFRELVDERARRRPVSRLLGRRGFWSLDLAIDDSVLDPRPDSESLIEAALARLDDRCGRGVPYQVLDLGVGSGCLLLALLAELPMAYGIGVDRSPAAVDCARANAVRLGLAARAGFVVGDWGRSLAGRFDIVLSNPPYIPDGELALLAPEVRCHDPRAALAGGPDGLGAYRRLAVDVARLLAPDGFAVIECGQDQASAVAAILEASGLTVCDLAPDLGGATRCISVTRYQVKEHRGKKSVGKYVVKR